MKVDDLVISNFGSFYGCHRIPFGDRGLVFVRGENQDEPKAQSNGSGKSTIFDALDWCLFGENPRGDSAKSVINDEAKKNCWVMAYLSDVDDRYIVFRFRALEKENGVKFFHIGKNKLWKNLTTLDEKETQHKINNALGLDRRIFRAAVYRGQGDDFVFANATDGERKETLTAIIPELEEIDALRDRAKALISTVQQKRAKEQGLVQQMNNELGSLQNTDWDGAREAWMILQGQKISEASTNVKISFDALQNAVEALTPLNLAQTQLDQLLGTKPSQDTQSQNEYDRLMAMRPNLTANLAALRAQYEATSDPFSRGEVNAGPCPVCKQPVSAQHIQAEIARIQTQRASLQVLGKNARMDLDELDAALVVASRNKIAEVAKNTLLAQEHAEIIGTLKTQVAGLKQLQLSISTLQYNHNSWVDHAETLQKEEWPGQHAKTQATARMADLYQAIGAAGVTVASLGHREKLLTFWLDALTAKGLKNLIMDSRIEEMSTAANEWVQALTGGTTWVRFETQTMTQGGKLSERMNIRIFRHNPGGTITERSFKSWSGGEKTRVALGVDQGLSKLVADRATKNWSLLILDESFSRGLDSAGREAVFDQIQKIKGGTVFVVDHSDLSGYFEQQLVVRCKNRRSEAFFGGHSCLEIQANHKHFLPESLIQSLGV